MKEAYFNEVRTTLDGGVKLYLLAIERVGRIKWCCKVGFIMARSQPLHKDLSLVFFSIGLSLYRQGV